MSEAAVDLEFLRRQLREAGIEEALGRIVGTFLESAPRPRRPTRSCG